MPNDVKNFGATGDGVTDDRVAIQAAIDDAVANNKGGILFPAGTYRVSRVNSPGGRWSLELNNVEDFMVAGEGPKSIVKLVDTSAHTGDWHVFILHNDCHRVVFKDLVIDGNRTGLTQPDEQSHGIEVENGTEDLVVDRCIVRECFGDGIRLVGTNQAGKRVRRVRIENSLIQSNKRSGIGIQRALQEILIANCHIDSTVTDQSIDFEPSGSGGPTEMVIQGCIINHTNRSKAVTISGVHGPDPTINCKFSNNILLGGPIFCTDVNRLAIQNNIVIVPDLSSAQRIPIQVQRGGDSIIISGNLLVNDDTVTEAVISLSEVNHRQVSRALIANNLCFARTGVGIACLSSDDVAIQNNMIVATAPCTLGVQVHSESSGMNNISVRDNDITVRDAGAWKIAILIASTLQNKIGDVSVIGNSIHGAADGIHFQNAGFVRTPICALNRIEDPGVTLPLVGLTNLPEHGVVVGGALGSGGAAAGSGTGRHIAGVGDPNNKVRGNVGDIFQRVDGTPGATFYVKETGDGTITGWTAK